MENPCENFNSVQLEALNSLVSLGYHKEDFIKIFPYGFAESRELIESGEATVERVADIFRRYL